ncbi:MAG: DUF2029 domain-containing protein [Anaerolineales bacterium]|nr:DUF2029 domain-containing protein [Anaerolineales bacterium]
MRSVYFSGTRIALFVLIPLMVFGLVYVNFRLAMQIPGGNDFLARWTGAHYWLVERTNPYDEEVSLAAQVMFYGRPADPTSGESLAHFYYPLYAMIFFAPFGLLSFPVARAIWMTLLQIALPLLLWIGLRIAKWNPGTALLALLMGFSIFWYPGVRSIFVGQFAVVEALLMAGALLAIQSRNDALGGILLALSTSKPQMAVLFIPFVLIWAVSVKRWRLLLWAAGSMVTLVVSSIILMPDWPLRWIWQIMDYAQYTKPGQPISIIASAFPDISRALTLGLTVIFLLYLAWEWVSAWQKDFRWFQWTAGLTIVLTNIVAFRTATTNYVVMLPALCLIFGNWIKRWGRRGTIAVLLAVLILGVGQWVLFFSTVQGNDESLIMYLPMPFLTLLGLWWVRWWSIRPEKLPLEGSFHERPA